MEGSVRRLRLVFLLGLDSFSEFKFRFLALLQIGLRSVVLYFNGVVELNIHSTIGSYFMPKRS